MQFATRGWIVCDPSDSHAIHLIRMRSTVFVFELRD